MKSQLLLLTTYCYHHHVAVPSAAVAVGHTAVAVPSAAVAVPSAAVAVPSADQRRRKANTQSRHGMAGQALHATAPKQCCNVATHGERIRRVLAMVPNIRWVLQELLLLLLLALSIRHTAVAVPSAAAAVPSAAVAVGHP